MNSSKDTVGNIHRRFYLTLINPSSHRTSLLIALACTSIISYITTGSIERTLLALPIAYILFRLDYILLRGYPVAKMSKVYHTNAFAMLLWLSILLLGIIIQALSGGISVIESMVFAVGLRIGIFTSVFGAPLKHSIPIAFVTPSVLAFTITGITIDAILSIPSNILIPSSVILVVIVWCILADRAGRPHVESTFRLLQAYLLAWTENDPRLMESMMESKAYRARVRTKMLSLYMNSKRADLILSDLHPGPFYPVGGSNLPYDINMKLRGIERGSHSLDDNSEYRREHVIVLHSISDHSLNLPSRSQVEIYLGSLDTRERIVEGSTCTEPVVVEGRYSYVTGVALGSTALLILESKHGMEDIPMRVRREVEEYSSAKGFKDVLLIDAHNSIGKHLNDEGADDMIDICKEALNSLASMKQYEFKAGVEHIELHGSDIGCTGAYVMMMHVNTSGLILIWIDANNALNGVREYIMDGLKRLYSAYKIVLCTSDTHATSGRARNRLGYYPLGTTTSRDRLASVLLDASSRASERLNRASYELSYSDSEVKVMGDEQFLYYSNALDRALMITKVSLLLTIVSLTSILLL